MKTVMIQLEMEDDVNRFVSVYKAKHDLETKAQAVNEIIKKFMQIKAKGESKK